MRALSSVAQRSASAVVTGVGCGFFPVAEKQSIECAWRSSCSVVRMTANISAA